MRLQPVQDGILAAGEFLPAGLAFQVSNRFLLSMAAVANQGMDAFIGDPEIFTI